MNIRYITTSFCCALLLGACSGNSVQPTTKTEPLLTKQDDFSNLLNIKNTPKEARDRSTYVFTDYGSWSGYALPNLQDRTYHGAFMGPMLMSGQGWVAPTLAQPELKINDQPFYFFYEAQTSEYLPGKLRQVFKTDQVHIVTELCFASRYEAVIQTRIQNISAQPIEIDLRWLGKFFQEEVQVELKEDGFAAFEKTRDVKVRLFNTNVEKVELEKDFLATQEKKATVAPGDTYLSAQSIWTYFANEEVQPTSNLLADQGVSILNANTERWNNFISRVLASDSKHLQDNVCRKVVVKAMSTLTNNWRASLDDLLFDGSYPSYCGFFGFWSWDSWKHASASALYNPELAKNEVRSLFAYQDKESGMIPDYVSRNKKRINWRDSKPPLSTWAVRNIYQATGDKEFVKEMYDQLLKYHGWWYTHRDHDGNGICEYGSTDGSLIAAAWESGMDNGVRFDDAVMLKNGPDYAWSMDQENICLNSFLYAEKLFLIELGKEIGRTEGLDKLQQEADFIKEYIQKNMYDAETGFFYDRKLETGELIKVMGAECWLPLWAGVATPEQAREVAKKMIDPTHFFTTVPLGTLDVSHPKLRATNGYWRGPVWIDQVYFGVTGLKRYGMEDEADRIIEQYIKGAYGLTSDGPIHENYNPLTGEPLNCPHFGWSSATTILMLLNK